jgi:hypothetical protein
LRCKKKGCHSREGGNLSTFLLPCCGWVPAFAGMTILLKGTSIYPSLFKRGNDNIAFFYILTNKSNGTLCIGVTADCAVKKGLSLPFNEVSFISQGTFKPKFGSWNLLKWPTALNLARFLTNFYLTVGEAARPDMFFSRNCCSK